MEEQKNKLESFKEVLTGIKELYQRGEVFVSLIPPFELFFDIDRKVLNTLLKELNLSEGSFKKTSEYIQSILLEILQEREEQFIKLRIKDLELEDKMAREEEEILHEQLKSVREALWSQHLKNRYDLKVSSKAPSFTSIDWDIKIKTKDAKLEKIRFPYATCRIAFQREFGGSPFALLGGRMFDTFQINFAIDEIDHMIKVFTTIRQHLKETEGETQQ